MLKDTYIHPTADISPQAEIGAGTIIWHQAHVREGAHLGCKCVIGKGVYIDHHVCIGDNVKVQNYALIYHGVTIEDGVFIGPRACLTNDKLPRAVTPDGTLKDTDDWEISPILVREGASIGAGAVVLPGVTIGRWAMVGAGTVVTHNVHAYGLVYGNPARLRGFVCPCGYELKQEEGKRVNLQCRKCGRMLELQRADWEGVW